MSADDLRERADALDSLADRLDEAESIAADVPVLSELFHEVRTSGRNPRDGRFVALLDLDGDGWTCRSVAFLQRGTHYRDTGADATLTHSPYPFVTVDQFADLIGHKLRADADIARQRAAEIDAQQRRTGQ